MRKEFGKWLMDIAKYIITAILLTSVFGDIEDKWIVYVICGLAVIVTLSWGLYLVKDPPVNNKRRK